MKLETSKGEKERVMERYAFLPGYSGITGPDRAKSTTEYPRLS